MNTLKTFYKKHELAIKLTGVAALGVAVGIALGAKAGAKGSEIQDLRVLVDPDTKEKTFQAITQNGVTSYFSGEPTPIEVEA